MLQPRKTKYRKQFRGKMRGIAGRGNTIEFGQYALKAQARGWITSRQIEAARKTMSRFTKKGGRIWIRIFPDRPISKKPPETRMGSGKGEVTEYVFTVKPGRILFEMGGLPKEIAEKALKQASSKLPIDTKILIK